jgi:hypothetical protein
VLLHACSWGSAAEDATERRCLHRGMCAQQRHMSTALKAAPRLLTATTTGPPRGSSNTPWKLCC